MCYNKYVTTYHDSTPVLLYMGLHGSTRSVPAPLPSVITSPSSVSNYQPLFRQYIHVHCLRVLYFQIFPLLGQLIFTHFSKSPPFLLHQYKSKISPNKIRWIKRAYAYRLDILRSCFQPAYFCKSKRESVQTDTLQRSIG